MKMQIGGRQFESRPDPVVGYKSDAELDVVSGPVGYFIDGQPVSRAEYERELDGERAKGNLKT